LVGDVEAFSTLDFTDCIVFLTRTAVFAFALLVLIVGNLIVPPRFGFVEAFFGETFVDVLVAFLDDTAFADFREIFALLTVIRAFETTFLTPDLIDDGAKGPRFLLIRERDLLRAFSFLRFAAFAFLASAISFSLAALSSARCSFSLFRGPKMPRHLAEPHRHCWTFFWEYGLL
jgi:hypothetical protein